MNIPATFYKIHLPLASRIQADKFRSYHADWQKAKQVYLNTLAVFAVNSHLNQLGWATNIQSSDSWNPLMQTMMNVADLDIPNYGKIECLWVLPEDKCIAVSSDVSGPRLAYVVVKLDNSLTEAELLGFIPQVNSNNLAFGNLESLTQLPSYLSQHKRAAISDRATQLSKWLEGLVESSWLHIEEVLSPSMRLNFRSSPRLEPQTTNNLFPGASRVKLINLEDPENNKIALILTVFTQNQTELDISVKVCSSNNYRYLPQGLEVVVLDTTKKPIMKAQANDTETIEFCFSGELGEHFAIEVSLDNYIKVEKFIV